MTKTPSIILVRPQMGENIGAAARAMANFGLGDLRLVAPRDGWPNPKASDTAGKALNVIDDARVHETVAAAVADCQFVLATTARERVMHLPVLEVREAMAELHARAARGEKCAVLFGPERTGLENEDIALADAVVTIPVAPEYASLNVGQAVVVCAYEWWQGRVTSDAWRVTREEDKSEGANGAAGAPLPLRERSDFQALRRLGNPGEGAVPLAGAMDTNAAMNNSKTHSRNAQRPENNSNADTNNKQPADRCPHPDSQPIAPRNDWASPTSPAGGGAQAAPPAPREHLLGLLGQLEAALDDVNFWRVPEKKEIMWRNIRTTLVRAGLSEQEIATWRGVVKALREGIGSRG